MKNFLVAVINKSFNMFVPTSNGYQPIAHIDEHFSRLTELSENCHIYMDDLAFKAFGEKTLPNRFTRVFVNHKDFDKTASTQFRLHHMEELDNIIKRKEFYEKNTRTFFIGSPEFLKLCAKYSDTILLTVVDTSNKPSALNFPEELQPFFNSRKTIKPEMLETIREYRKMVIPKDTVEIADNGMKIIKKANIEELSQNDMLFTPDYMFYEMRKTGTYEYSFAEYSKNRLKELIGTASENMAIDPSWRQGTSDIIQ